MSRSFAADAYQWLCFRPWRAVLSFNVIILKNSTVTSVLQCLGHIVCSCGKVLRSKRGMYFTADTPIFFLHLAEFIKTAIWKLSRAIVPPYFPQYLFSRILNGFSDPPRTSKITVLGVGWQGRGFWNEWCKALPEFNLFLLSSWVHFAVFLSFPNMNFTTFFKGFTSCCDVLFCLVLRSLMKLTTHL